VLSLATGAKQDMTDYPHIQAWLKRCQDRPAYRKATGVGPVDAPTGAIHTDRA
jgi:glutathione S-transferase